MERIVAKRIEAPGEVEYLIKWRGTTYADASWELAEDVAEDDAITEFESRQRLPTREEWVKPLKAGRTERSKWAKHASSPAYKGGNKLRAYQLEGLNWLSFCWHKKDNSILADEMGLGKTVQSVSLLHYLFSTQGVWGPCARRGSNSHVPARTPPSSGAHC